MLVLSNNKWPKNGLGNTHTHTVYKALLKDIFLELTLSIVYFFFHVPRGSSSRIEKVSNFKSNSCSRGAVYMFMWLCLSKWVTLSSHDRQLVTDIDTAEGAGLADGVINVSAWTTCSAQVCPPVHRPHTRQFSSEYPLMSDPTGLYVCVCVSLGVGDFRAPLLTCPSLGLHMLRHH